MEIKNPQWLEIKSNQQTIYGLRQTWFGSAIKRASGCGPTAASTLLLYLNKRDTGPLPYKNNDVESATRTLEDVWKYVTPGMFGISKTKKFTTGVKRLIDCYGASWACQELTVKKSDPIEKVASFIEYGLASDCPIAFLNLHAGKTDAFEGWHWLVLIALNRFGNRYTATGYDCGKKIKFDLGLWLESTKIGGGFVYMI